jgi:hypothetical protein
MQRTLSYKDFEITLPDPPQTPDKWEVNLGSDDLWLFAKLGRSSKMIAGATLEDALEKAKRFIDSL